jgi:hypothetical protein
MTTYDVVLLLAIVVWWLMFRRKYDWRAVVLFYMGGVLVVDVLCAMVILVAYRSHPNVISLPALLMPLGGIGGLVYAASKNKLTKGSGLFTGAASDKR